MSQEPDEMQERTCRCCDRAYRYPVPRELATRFYCADCAGLPKPTRGLLERFNKRLRRLDARLGRLERACGGEDEA